MGKLLILDLLIVFYYFSLFKNFLSVKHLQFKQEFHFYYYLKLISLNITIMNLENLLFSRSGMQCTKNKKRAKQLKPK